MSSDNNQAVVASLGNIRQIEGADRIVQASVMLKGIPVTDVVVGVESNEGDRVVYFSSNLALEETTILKDYPDLSRYLGKRGRVKTVKLRGVYSDGLCVELDKFSKYDQDAMAWEEGTSFNDVCGIHLCHKYQPLIKVQGAPGKKKGRKGKKISRMVEGQFHFHIDTSHLARNIHKIHPNDVISITHKVHGTSAIVSNCLVKKPLGILSRILRFFGVPIVDTEYDYLYSSRSVVKNGCVNTGFYSTDIWTEAGQVFKGKLAQGETVYYEIVGYLPNGGWIQKNYDYGCKPGEHKVFVYRITKTSPDGHVSEYSWPAVKARCEELGVNHVTELFYGKAFEVLDYDDTSIDDWRVGVLARLKLLYLEKPLAINLCKKVPDEGIVIRKEVAGIEVYKYKSQAFLKAEIDAYEEDGENIEDSEADEIVDSIFGEEERH